eukprot:GILK01011217.1.p1 GENE.GILK01011217.1~~GILK01011217.1.p1  ORF type:complete len:564 (-),score=78.52 GILK01011217.1:186-1877(-)
MVRQHFKDGHERKLLDDDEGDTNAGVEMQRLAGSGSSDEEEGVSSRNPKHSHTQADTVEDRPLTMPLKDIIMFPVKLWRDFAVWSRNMKEFYGLTFLSVVCTVYWAQGFRSFAMLATTFFYKEELGLSIEASQAMLTTIYLPWSIKPIYGLLSDNIPFFGYHRKSYITFSGVISAVPLLIMSLPAITSANATTAMFLISQIGVALSDVVVDAIIVIEGRNDPQGGAANLQSLCWSMLSVGGLLGSWLGGLAAAKLSARSVFGLLSVCPLSVFVMSFFLQEPKSTTPVSTVVLKAQAKLLFRAVTNSRIWKPTLWVFLANSLSPSCEQMMTYFKKDVLHFDEEFLGLMNVLGYLALVIGTAAYNRFLKPIPLRRILIWAQIILAFLSSFELILVTRFNVDLGIPDKAFAVGDEVLSGVFGQAFKQVPLLVLAANLCPPGIEGTLFALLMALNNLAWIVSSYSGAAFASILGVSATDFSKLWILILFRSLGKLSVVLLWFLLPSDQQESQTVIQRLVSAESRNTSESGEWMLSESTHPDATGDSERHPVTVSNSERSAMRQSDRL